MSSCSIVPVGNDGRKDNERGDDEIMGVSQGTVYIEEKEM